MKTGIFANTYDDARLLARHEKLEDDQWFFISSIKMLFGCERDMTVLVLEDSAEYREDCHDIMLLMKERDFLIKRKKRMTKKKVLIKRLRDLDGNLIRNSKK
jgi:hypothetical protein